MTRRKSTFVRAALSITGALLLTGCSTLSAINPYDGGDEADQGSVAGDDRRISILEIPVQFPQPAIVG